MFARQQSLSGLNIAPALDVRYTSLISLSSIAIANIWHLRFFTVFISVIASFKVYWDFKFCKGLSSPKGTAVKPNLTSPSQPQFCQEGHASNKTDFTMFKRLVAGINVNESLMDIEIYVSSFYKSLNGATFLSVPVSPPCVECSHPTWYNPNLWIPNELHKDTSLNNEISNELEVIHQVLEKILNAIPMAFDAILDAIESLFPHYKRYSYISYIHNLLKLLEYKPIFTEYIIQLLMEKLAILDVDTPRHEIEDLERDDDHEDSKLAKQNNSHDNNSVPNSLQFITQNVPTPSTCVASLGYLTKAETSLQSAGVNAIEL
uniref:Uncharacterized protein n=1 Tax=Glossina morsitans morsitans TaxID=37546 RepID=A0A1B0FL60_GLOMM